jgi:Rha family phage regulatory protein
MEGNTAIQVLQMDNQVLVDSRVIAKGIGIEHESLMKTIHTYQSELEEFGQLRFEIGVGYRPQGGGNPFKYALLNRNQIGVVTSLSRNTPEVVRFKVDLFKAIDAMEQQLVLSDALITALLDKLNHLPKGLSFVEVDLASLLATHFKRFMQEVRSLLEQKDLPAKDKQKLLQVLSAIDQNAERYFAITEKLCELDQALLSALLAYRRALPELSETKPLE